MENEVTIKIPRELYQGLRQMITCTGFSSVNEFIVFVMRTMASGGEIGGEDRVTAKDVRSIRESLRKLDYLREEEGARIRKVKVYSEQVGFIIG